MKKRIITNRNDKFNELGRLLSEISRESEEKLVYFAYLKGHSLSEIGAVLGVSRQALSQKYPELTPAFRKQRNLENDIAASQKALSNNPK